MGRFSVPVSGPPFRCLRVACAGLLSMDGLATPVRIWSKNGHVYHGRQRPDVDSLGSCSLCTSARGDRMQAMPAFLECICTDIHFWVQDFGRTLRSMVCPRHVRVSQHISISSHRSGHAVESFSEFCNASTYLSRHTSQIAANMAHSYSPLEKKKRRSDTPYVAYDMMFSIVVQ